MISGGRRATALQVQVLIFCEVVQSHQKAGIGAEIPAAISSPKEVVPASMAFRGQWLSSRQWAEGQVKQTNI